MNRRPARVWAAVFCSLPSAYVFSVLHAGAYQPAEFLKLLEIAFRPAIDIDDSFGAEKRWSATGWTGPIHWAEHETSREGVFRYGAKDTAGHQAEYGFRRRFLRNSDKDKIPDQRLSIAPIPMRIMVSGQEIEPIPIVVRTTLPGPVRFKIQRRVIGGQFYADLHSKPGVNGIHSLESEGLFIRPVTEGVPSFGQSEEVVLHHFEVAGTFKPKYDSELDDTRGGRRLIYTVQAMVQGQRVSAPMLILARDFRDWYLEHRFVPIPDITVTNGEAITPIMLAFHNESDDLLKGMRFSTTGLPPGLRLDTALRSISGSPRIDDWQSWEKERRFCVSAYSSSRYAQYVPEGDRKGEVADFGEYLDVTQFNITVLRDTYPPPPGIIPIPDQTVDNQTVFAPVHVACDTPGLEFFIDIVDNLPPGLRLGQGRCIEGFVDITDWQENEAERDYQVTIRGGFIPPKKSRSDGVETISMAIPASASFVITVHKQQAKTDENPPMPAIEVTGPMYPMPADVESLPKIPPFEITDVPSSEAVDGELAQTPSVPIKEGQRMAVLLSEENSYAMDLLSGTLLELASAGYEHGNTTMDILRLTDEKFRPEQLSEGGYALVLAIGQRAADVAREQLGAAFPLVTAGAQAVSGTPGVEASVSAEALLSCIWTMQPDAKTIGYLHMNDTTRVTELSNLAALQGKAVQAAEFKDPAQFTPEANKLLASADLLILAEEPAQQEEMVKFFEEAVKAGKAVYVMKQELLFKGAAIACFADPMRGGEQLGRLAARILGGETLEQIQPEASPNILITFNPFVLQDLNIIAPPDIMPAIN